MGFKLSHHGSRANVTSELLKAVRADHYIFSTNNAIFNHPDEEAVARVLVHGGRQPTLGLTTRPSGTGAGAEAALRAKYGYQLQYPAGGRSGVSVELAARMSEGSA